MSSWIRDDRREQVGSPTKASWPTGFAGWASLRFAPALAAVVVLVGLPVISRAQDSLEATVSEVQENREWIHVPVNKSVLIETNLPAVRQQVLSPDIARIESISPTQLLVTGQAFGRTQVIIWSADGQQQVFDISVELELDLLAEAIRQVEPMARVEAIPVMETVILTGTVPDATTADRIMQIASIFAPNIQNHLQVAGEQQVLIRCTVAEMSRNVVRQLGINGFMNGSDLRSFPLVSNIGGINPTSFGQPAGLPVTSDAPFLGGGSDVLPTTTLSFAFPRAQMQVFIRALQENSLLRVLAEPNLVTISGRTASFLAGGEFPVPVPQSGGGGGTGGTTITIEYREFGARLSFTPVVLDNHTMRMTIAPEVSELDESNGVTISGFRVPGLNSRRVETTVECASGQTLAIAGLLSETVRATASKVPWIGEVPVLGALFSSTQFQKRITELVIMITPEIVAPLDPDEVPPLPGEGFMDPDDWQLYALGMLDGSGNDGSASGDGDDYMEEPGNADTPMGPWGMSDYEEQPPDDQ